jgi:hypothetical protein
MEDPLRLRVEAHTLYVMRMLTRLGYGPEALDEHPHRETVWAQCRSCCAARECARWLEGRAGLGGDEVPHFCPNRDHLVSLAQCSIG